MWITLQVTLGLLGLLLAFAGDKLSMPILFSAGISCLGLTSMAIGWEAIFTQRIVLGSRRHYARQLYMGVPAIFQGMQFNLFGLFLIVVAFLMYFNNGREVFLQMVRRPGSLLVLFGGLCLMQSVISFAGPLDTNESPRWVATTYLLFARLLPGSVLVILGLLLTGLGLFEAVAPAAFDQMGGKYLELLYGLK